jgi:hypothetical protein
MMKGKSFLKVPVILHLVLFSLFSGCKTTDVDNNHLKIVDLINHFTRSGLKIEDVIIMRHDVVHAQAGVALKIKGRNVGIYKYNLMKNKQKAKLEKIKKDGFVFLCGMKYPAMVKGSFIMIDYNSNPDKKKIIEAFEDFDEYEAR